MVKLSSSMSLLGIYLKDIRDCLGRDSIWCDVVIGIQRKTTKRIDSYCGDIPEPVD